MLRIRIVWSSLTVYADRPESNKDHIGNDAQYWYPNVHHKHYKLGEKHEHREDGKNKVERGYTVVKVSSGLGIQGTGRTYMLDQTKGVDGMGW